MQVLSTQQADNWTPLALSEEECDAVDGAWGPPGAAFGAVMGGLQYGIGVAFGSNNNTIGGWATAIGTGAVVGGLGGPVSAVRGVWITNATIGGGTAHAITTM